MKIWMRKALTILTAFSFVLMADAALAAKKKKGKKKKKGGDAAGEMTEEGGDGAGAASGGGGGAYRYGMAGCGLGSILMGADGSQVLAATTNGTAWSQFFGITTGTSNCSDAPAEMAQVEQEIYIEANFASLSKEAAQGSGETLAGLAEVLGCEDKASFADACQRNHGSIFSEDQVQTVRQKILDVVKSDENLAKSCTRAS